MQGGVRITVPGDPKAKGRPRIGKDHFGRAMAFTPPDTEKAEAAVRSIALAALGDRQPFDVPVVLHLLATMPVPPSWSKKRQAAALAGAELPAKKPDLDNLVKLALDAINKVVFVDDAQIVEIRARKVYGAEPSTVIFVVPDAGRAA